MGQINFEISEAQIQNAIAVAIAESFSEEKKDQIIKDVVRAHLSSKETTYDRETILSKAVGNAIRNEAAVAFKEVVEEMKPKIKKEINKHLGKSFEDSLFESIKYAISNIKLTGFNIVAQYND